MSKIKTISITKKELKIITSAIKELRLLNTNDNKKFQEFQKLSNKFNKLSEYFDYSINPIMYDEF
tara:strand:+ start:4228 stop:4422 length:195 start_codon:yes stop_codon:yes gene_type:complete